MLKIVVLLTIFVETMVLFLGGRMGGWGGGSLMNRKFIRTAFI